MVTIHRKDFKFIPDSSRVVARFFDTGSERTEALIHRINELSENEILMELNHTLREFTGRHRNISQVFKHHAENYSALFNNIGISWDSWSKERKYLLGSYATMEYSIESAALFNPSIVEDLDQSFLQKGEKRVIISLRATGEGHLSSIVFRRGVLDSDNNLILNKVRNHIDLPKIIQKQYYNKLRFLQKLEEMGIPNKIVNDLHGRLGDRFEYHELKQTVTNYVGSTNLNSEEEKSIAEITWLVDSYYDIEFSMDSDISERVIFPISPSESQGIEDARFVNFEDDNGNKSVIGVYTAYDGRTIIPKLIQTSDFRKFRIMPLHGKAAQNKNFALFPKKINGNYAMLARVDGINNYLIRSNRINLWNEPIKIQSPKFPWEFTQIGNCGSPIFTTEGWLYITHGVGPMRRYCIGASLFDLNDPTKELGRLSQPILAPLETEREGYVPNVVYSCGSLIKNDHLILPYAVSDYSSSYATINVRELLQELKKSPI